MNDEGGNRERDDPKEGGGGIKARENARGWKKIPREYMGAEEKDVVTRSSLTGTIPKTAPAMP